MRNLYLPNGMSLESLPFSKPKDKEKAAKVLSCMLKWSVLTDETQTGVQINSKFLRKIAGGNYAKIIRPLVAEGIISVSQSYKVGERSKTYSFVESFTGVEVIKTKGNWRKKPKGEIPAFLIKQFNKLTINEGAMEKEEVKKALEAKVQNGNVKVPEKYAFCYKSIREKDWFFSRDEYGRLHTNVTSCPRALRKELRNEGQELKGIDLKSSQPTLLLYIINEDKREIKDKRIEEIIRKEEMYLNIVLWHKMTTLRAKQGFADYQKEIKDGVFYDAFMGKLPTEHSLKKNRDEVKKQILKCFFGRGYETSCIREELWGAYPFLAEAVQMFKPKGHHQRFARLLQKIESHLFIDLIASRINREIPNAPIFTIHDSLYTTEEYKERVFRMVREECTEFLGFEPHFGYE